MWFGSIRSSPPRVSIARAASEAAGQLVAPPYASPPARGPSRRVPIVHGGSIPLDTKYLGVEISTLAGCPAPRPFMRLLEATGDMEGDPACGIQAST